MIQLKIYTRRPHSKQNICDAKLSRKDQLLTHTADERFSAHTATTINIFQEQRYSDGNGTSTYSENFAQPNPFTALAACRISLVCVRTTYISVATCVKCICIVYTWKNSCICAYVGRLSVVYLSIHTVFKGCYALYG